MTKQIAEKILSGKTLDTKTVSADEKKAIYDVMVQHGMSQSTAYLRFFDKGFKPWELLGVTKLLENFLLSHPIVQQDCNGDIRKAYKTIKKHRLGLELCYFMAEHGMASSVTARKRFRTNNWRPWELKGIKSIIEENLCVS